MNIPLFAFCRLMMVVVLVGTVVSTVAIAADDDEGFSDARGLYLQLDMDHSTADLVDVDPGILWTEDSISFVIAGVGIGYAINDWVAVEGRLRTPIDGKAPELCFTPAEFTEETFNTYVSDAHQTMIIDQAIAAAAMLDPPITLQASDVSAFDVFQSAQKDPMTATPPACTEGLDLSYMNLDVSAIFSVPLGRGINFHGRVGYQQLTATAEGSVTLGGVTTPFDEDDFASSDFFGGAGISYSLGGNWQLRNELISENNGDAVSLSGSFAYFF